MKTVMRKRRWKRIGDLHPQFTTAKHCPAGKLLTYSAFKTDSPGFKIGKYSREPDTRIEFHCHLSILQFEAMNLTSLSLSFPICYMRVISSFWPWNCYKEMLSRQTLLSLPFFFLCLPLSNLAYEFVPAKCLWGDENANVNQPRKKVLVHCDPR